MSRIQKFSLIYDPLQDRIAWIAEDREGATTRLWFTQRICRSLVAALLPRLETATTAPDLPPEHKATVQSWEQAAAVAQHVPVPPVVQTPQTAGGLVHTIQFRPTTEGFVLILRFGQAEERRIGLTMAELRQTLNALYGLYVKADWPLDIWPSWISEPLAAAAAAGPAN
jgi:hypothetical protein